MCEPKMANYKSGGFKMMWLHAGYSDWLDVEFTVSCAFVCTI